MQQFLHSWHFPILIAQLLVLLATIAVVLYAKRTFKKVHAERLKYAEEWPRRPVLDGAPRIDTSKLSKTAPVKEVDASMSSFIESIGGKRVAVGEVRPKGPIIVQPMATEAQMAALHESLLGMHESSRSFIARLRSQVPVVDHATQKGYEPFPPPGDNP